MVILVNTEDWKKEYRKNVHIMVISGLIGMILYEIYKNTNPYKFGGFFIIIIYIVVIFFDYKKEPSNLRKSSTIRLFGSAIIISIFISFLVFPPFPVHLITFFLIQGFIWISSCLFLEKEPIYRNKSSVKALELIHNNFNNAEKHYITVGILIIAGVGAGIGIETFGKNGFIGFELAGYNTS